MKPIVPLILAFSAAWVAVGPPARGLAVPVDLEPSLLSLLIDAILGGTHGAIAVNAIEFNSRSSEVIPFTLLDSEPAILTFADSLDALATRILPTGGTSPAQAYVLAIGAMGDETGAAPNGFESTRQIIDITGDGPPNPGREPDDERDTALAAGVDAINGLAIEIPSNSFPATVTAVHNFYLGGNDSFLVEARIGDDLHAKVLQKLHRDVAGIPEPASAALLVLGSSVLTARRRRIG